MTTSNWEDLGISFSVIPPSRYTEACQFIHQHFCPDEPITRSLDICHPGTFFNALIDQLHFMDFLKSGQSLMATDKEGKLLGIRVGKKVTRSTYNDHKWLFKLISSMSWMLPRAWGQLCLVPSVYDAVGYDVAKAFDRLGCDVLYESTALIVAKEARVRGLGTELIKRCNKLASDCGCQYMYILATGEYSSKVFFKLGFNLENEYMYENFKDNEGNAILKDTREHQKGRVFYFKLSETD